MPRQQGSSLSLIRVNGERILELRADQGMTQLELAERSRISTGYISQLESGARPGLSKRLFNRLAESLSVPGEEIQAQDLTAVSARTETLKFTGVGFNDATAAELAREIRQAGAYLNRITRALQSKLRE